MKKYTWLPLLLIILLAAFLRIWQIGEYPAGFNADEAACAYNSYSLIETGKDEFGTSWPIHFTSFADYKPGGMVYLMMPFTRLFGLETTASRLPSILAGILSVLLIFLLVKELFESRVIALIAAFFLAISPWHLHFSRGAWETNIATTFILAGTYFFFLGLKNNKYFLLWVIFFALSLYTYHAPRIIAPLLAVFLLAYNYKVLFKHAKPLLLSFSLGILVSVPLLLSLTGPAVSARFSGLSVFSDGGSLWEVNYLRGEHQEDNLLAAKAFHNRPYVNLLRVSENWLSHFNGAFLFINGDDVPRSRIPNMGQMYLFDLLFVLAGIIFMFKNRPKNYFFVIFWLMVSPLAAALTFQVPSALRALNMVIPLVIISAYGFYQLFDYTRRSLSKKFFYLLNFAFVLILMWNLGYYLNQYYIEYPKAYPDAWEYGVKQLVDYVHPNMNKYDKIYVTDKYDQPYILFLYYLKYPPQNFQKQAVLTARDKFGFSTVRDFDKFHFEEINWDKLKGENGALVCGTDKEIPDNIKIIHTINFKNDKIAFQCAEI